MRYTFKKSEKLCNQSVIDLLYKKGSVLYCNPIKLTYIFKIAEATTSTKVLVAVPKRNHKKAVTRNLLKRRIRESYRLNKHLLVAITHPQALDISISLQYISKEILPYETIDAAIITALKKLIVVCNQHTIIIAT
jgi:ribonuclease P protein component